jgi:hypothetical protein
MGREGGRVMAVWDVYADINGTPVYAQVELVSGLSDDEAFEEVLDMFRSTLEVTIL